MKYKVLLTTSGLGQRLGDITQFTNKSLVRVGEKPTISYIVEMYPKNVEIVVTLGHFGSHVKQFLQLVYPDRQFTFIEVDKYQGPGSSLAYSILQAYTAIDCPFIFHACDTIVSEKIPEPSCNWLGGYKIENRSDYASFDSNSDGKVTSLKDKGELNQDFSYIGLAGIYDFNEFFQELSQAYLDDSTNSQISDVIALRAMMHNGVTFESREYSQWFDVGNVDGLRRARQLTKDKFEILDKLEESIFLFDKKFVVKFFSDEKLCTNRVIRGKLLGTLVPRILGSDTNFYMYEYVKGDLLSHCASELKITKLLNWADYNLWVPKIEPNFNAKCFDFYITKTKQRIEKFTKETGVQDVDYIINDISIPSIAEMLVDIDAAWLCDGMPSQFHGDFILDNIIYDNGEFILLDWRQDFAGELEIGDLYYDLAKLNHNMIFNHDIVNKNLFTIDIKQNEIRCDILRSHNLVQCQKAITRFCEQYNLDRSKVDMLTALIWINMAALHHYPLNNFLFYFGKYHLYKAIYELS